MLTIKQTEEFRVWIAAIKEVSHSDDCSRDCARLLSVCWAAATSRHNRPTFERRYVSLKNLRINEHGY